MQKLLHTGNFDTCLCHDCKLRRELIEQMHVQVRLAEERIRRSERITTDDLTRINY